MTPESDIKGFVIEVWVVQNTFYITSFLDGEGRCQLSENSYPRRGTPCKVSSQVQFLRVISKNLSQRVGQYKIHFISLFSWTGEGYINCQKTITPGGICHVLCQVCCKWQNCMAYMTLRETHRWQKVCTHLRVFWLIFGGGVLLCEQTGALIVVLDIQADNLFR